MAVRNYRFVGAAVAAVSSFALVAGLGSSAASASSGAVTAKAAGGSEAQTLAWVKKNAPGTPASLVKQACAQGNATVYLQSLANVPGYVSAMEKALPCLSVSDYAAPGGVIASRFTTESQSKKYNADVIMNTSPVFLQSMIKKGYLEKYTPATAKLVPANLQKPGYWYSTTLTTLTIAWNSQAVTSQQQKQLQSIKTWKDVFNVKGLAPGKMGIIDIAAGGSDELPWYYLQQAYGKNFMSKFKSQFNPEDFASIITASARLASGGTPVVFAALDGVPGGYIAKGAQIQWVYPKPYLATPLAIAMSSHAPHAAAAKLAETWMLSKAGQVQMETDNYSDPLSSAIGDNRAFAKDSWFKEAPASQDYAANWLKIQNALPSLTKQFSSVFGAAQS